MKRYIKSSIDKRKSLYLLHNERGNTSRDIEELAMKYQPDVQDITELTDKTINRIYDTLKERYQRQIDRYGDDAEVDYAAIEVFF